MKLKTKPPQKNLKLHPLNASSAEDLVGKLPKYDGKVPGLGKQNGRKTEDCENWQAVYFLRQIALSGLMDYPLSINPGEKPDLVLSSGSGETGIELTELIHPDLAKIQAELENLCHEMGIEEYWWSPPAVSIHERISFPREILVEIVTGKCLGGKYPIVGNENENNWVEAIELVLTRKVEKFQKGYSKLDKNWLVIYDDWMPGIHDYPLAVDLLSKRLLNFAGHIPFNSIFILATEGDAVWELNCRWEYHKHVTNT